MHWTEGFCRSRVEGSKVTVVHWRLYFPSLPTMTTTQSSPSHSIKLPRRLAFVRAPMADLFLSYRELVNKGFDLNQGRKLSRNRPDGEGVLLAGPRVWALKRGHGNTSIFSHKVAIVRTPCWIKITDYSCSPVTGGRVPTMTSPSLDSLQVDGPVLQASPCSSTE